MALKKLILIPQAERDFREAYEWYEKQSAGLGREFAQCVDEKMVSIAHKPQIYPLIYKNRIRRALVNRFPFSIYFTEQQSSISVIAILHQHRNPNFWKTRG